MEKPSFSYRNRMQLDGSPAEAWGHARSQVARPLRTRLWGPKSGFNMLSMDFGKWHRYKVPVLAGPGPQISHKLNRLPFQRAEQPRPPGEADTGRSCPQGYRCTQGPPPAQPLTLSSTGLSSCCCSMHRWHTRASSSRGSMKRRELSRKVKT